MSRKKDEYELARSIMGSEVYRNKRTGKEYLVTFGGKKAKLKLLK